MIYTAQQWIADFDYVYHLQLNPDLNPVSLREQAQNYFYGKYRDESALRFARFDQAMRFLDQHTDDLSFGGAAVAGSTEFLVKIPLILALHEYFTSLPISEIGKSSDIHQIKKLAIKHGA